MTASTKFITPYKRARRSAVATIALVLMPLLVNTSLAAPDPSPAASKGKDAKSAPPIAITDLVPLPGPPDTKRKADAPTPPAANPQPSQEASPPTPALACAGEADAFCPDLEGQPLFRCLAVRVEDLGRLCLLGLRPYANAWLQKSCVADARQFCLGLKNAELLVCLVEERPHLTMACGVAVELAPAMRGKTTGVAVEMPATKKAVSQ